MMLTTEYGVFTANKKTEQTAQEVYEAWLEVKDAPPQPTDKERIDQLENMILMMMEVM